MGIAYQCLGSKWEWEANACFDKANIIKQGSSFTEY